MNPHADDLTVQKDLSVADLERIQSSGIIAVDTEMTGLNPNRDLLCLVQICDVNNIVNIIKTRNWSEANNLIKVLTDSSIIKVIHFAVSDCSFFLTNMAVTVINPYCTKIASKIARTYSPDHDLKTLVSEFFNVELDKTQTSTDWLRDDLSLKQLQYAMNDVKWLIPLKSKLEAILSRKGVLPSGASYIELNEKCQSVIPTLVQLSVHGWDFGREDRNSVFGI
jgi:ribonuclease D